MCRPRETSFALEAVHARSQMNSDSRCDFRGAVWLALRIMQTDWMWCWELDTAQEWGFFHGHPVTLCLDTQSHLFPVSGASSHLPCAWSAVHECPQSWCRVLLPTADSPGVVPGIIGAVVVAVAGAISSFIAYQKKKLCFKENGKVLGAASFRLCLANLKSVLSQN